VFLNHDLYHWRFFLRFSFPSEHWQALLHWVKCCRNRKACVDKCVEGMNIDYKLLWHYISYHFRYVTGLSWLYIWQKADHYNAMPNRPNLLICCYTSWLLKSFHALASTRALKLALGMFLFSYFCHVNWVTEFVASNWCVHYLAGSGKWLFPMAEASDRCEPFFHTLISAKSAYLLISLLVMNLTRKETFLNFL